MSNARASKLFLTTVSEQWIESGLGFQEFILRQKVFLTFGVTIADDIQLLTGKFMHSFYMTQGTIKPSQKKLKGSNQDCGGYEIGLEGFYPGIEKAEQKWIQNLRIDFKGIVIIQSQKWPPYCGLREVCYNTEIKTINLAHWGPPVSRSLY